MRVTTRSLGKGARCAPPLHPPGLRRITGIEPVQRHEETSLSPNPIDQRACLPLGTQPLPARRASVPAPLDPMTEALSLASGHLTTRRVPPWTCTEGFALGDEQRAFLPLCNPDQPCAVWMPSERSRPEPDDRFALDPELESYPQHPA